MRNYYVQYHGARNRYSLVWCPAEQKLDVEEWMRITRRKAIELCTAERRRRCVEAESGMGFGGFADTYIWPYDMEDDDRDYYRTYGPDDRRYSSNGYIVEEVIA